MTNTIDSIAPAQPVSAPAAAASSETRVVAQAELQQAPVEDHRPKPIALDVQRGEDGVFVYTLSDPSTGRLVAVIPDTAHARTAGNYAAGGWVSLTA